MIIRILIALVLGVGLTVVHVLFSVSIMVATMKLLGYECNDQLTLTTGIILGVETLILYLFGVYIGGRFGRFIGDVIL